MASPVPAALTHHAARDANRDLNVGDYNFLPDFAWAAVGGVVALAACALVVMLTVSWGGGPSITSYTRELVAGFLAGSLVVLIARSLTTRTR